MTAKRCIVALSLLASAFVYAGEPNTLSDAEKQAGFKLLFDGTTFTGWDGDPAIWSVAGGAIVGKTTAEKPIKGNTFAIWRGGQPADFELRVSWKIEGGNSGIQYRSRDFGNWVVGGYQADMDAGHGYTGILYEERGRGIMALRGEKLVWGDKGGKQVCARISTEKAVRDAIKADGWNDYVIIADGARVIQKLNGVTTMDMIDEEEAKRAAAGILAFQVHAGPPMTVRFRDVKLREIKAGARTAAPETLPASAWTPLFDGKTFGGWDAVLDEGCGKAAVADGQLVLDAGNSMTGIVWTRDFPTSNYEVTLEACRLEGFDFFCGLTFPVGKECCTFIVGGWGGSCVGLSNVDRQAADSNVTTKWLQFDANKWYALRLRVTDAKIEAWIDNVKQIDLAREGHAFTIWPQQEPCRPFGVATWNTKAGLRNFKFARW